MGEYKEGGSWEIKNVTEKPLENWDKKSNATLVYLNDSLIQIKEDDGSTGCGKHKNNDFCKYPNAKKINMTYDNVFMPPPSSDPSTAVQADGTAGGTLIQTNEDDGSTSCGKHHNNEKCKYPNADLPGIKMKWDNVSTPPTPPPVPGTDSSAVN